MYAFGDLSAFDSWSRSGEVEEADFIHVRDWISGLLADVKQEPSEEDPELSDLPHYAVRRVSLGMTKAVEVFYQIDLQSELIHLLLVGRFIAGDE